MEGVLLLAAAGLVAGIFCFFRKSFHACVEELDGSWLPLLFPLVMLLALSALLRQGDCSGALQYMENWQGQLTRAETRSWCRSAAVNAVLSAYLAGAEEAGGSLDAEAPLPEEFPVEELDLCVVLANALENAVHACQAAPEGAPRQIKQELALTDRRRLSGLSPAYCPG